MVDIPRVTGTFHPAFAEEWVDLVLGMLIGLENGMDYSDKRC